VLGSLLKQKPQAFETFKIFIYGLKMKLNLVLALFILIMEGNTLQMSLKATFPNMGSSIKPLFHTILDIMVPLKE
jgi:hypothetical protein